MLGIVQEILAIAEQKFSTFLSVEIVKVVVKMMQIAHNNH
jgi:hypothetical protein